MADINSTLPITRVIKDIIAVLENKNGNQNLVLQAEPGAGKSTLVPLEILKSDILKGNKILMLEPRRMAAKSIANYLSSTLKEPVGQTIGYRIKNETKVSSQTKLEIITEGVLTRIIQNDPELTNIGLIIFDEFHERSLNADISLMLAKEVQQSIRDDLLLMVMSATIDTQMIANYLGNANIITCPGRSYPVEIGHVSPVTNRTNFRDLSQSVNGAIKQLFNAQSGDILVFLPGIKEINQCIDVANNIYQHEEVILLPLHGALPLDQQEVALQQNKDGKRKIIFSTNIAETSLTIEGITGVVDSGLERTLTFDPNRGMTRLETMRISKASAEQRKGRAGRLSSGHCIRLWSETEHQSLNNFQAEEILNADLSSTVLDLAKWGSINFESIDWLTKPPAAHFDSAKALLISLGMLSDSGKITHLGKAASILPVSPRLAKMILIASTPRQKEVACLLAATLSERDIFVQKGHTQTSADLSLRFNLLENDFKEIKASNNAVRLHSVRAIKDTASNLLRQFKTIDRYGCEEERLSETFTTLDSILPALLMQAFPDRLAKRRGKNTSRYILANGKGASLNESDPLNQHEWLVVNHCDLRAREGKIFSATAIDIALIKAEFTHHLSKESRHSFDDKNGRFSSQTHLCYRNLNIQQLDNSAAPKHFIDQICKQQLSNQGKSLLNWTAACESWMKRLIWLGSINGNNNFPAYTEQQIFDKSDEWLLPYIKIKSNIAELKKVDVLPLLKAIIPWDQLGLLDKLAPELYTSPSGKKVTIKYEEAQGPTVSIVLQEMFGETQSPKLANKVNVRFELLSPARRPIQITSDIGQFWTSSYFEVTKDMRAKYPKHRWPDKPLDEKPGKSIKRRT